MLVSVCNYGRDAVSGRKKQFKIRYVVLGVLLVLVIAVAAVIGTHWELIQAAKTGLTTDLETIQAEQEKKDQEILDSLGVTGMITDEMIAQAQAEIEQSWAGESGGTASASAETPQEGQQPASGGQTAGQPAQSPGQSQQSGTAGNAGAGAGSTGDNSSGTPLTGKDIVVKYTAKLYGIRAAFQGRLDGIIASAKEEYAALPAEKRTRSAQNAILSSKMEQAGAVEEECDAQVEAILSEMSAELSAAGESTDSVDQLRNYYKDAKATQKAVYFAQVRGS